jgi:alkanesulfonate monooxygenase SsuD/methylene tetrahydromethanopterin reductase-like flavin-dependent oxidoreductase (luciferase family)
VAETADIWNGDGDTPDSFARRNAILDGHCEAVGRDPASIERTVGLPPPLIRATRDEALDALTDILERHAPDRDAARRAAEASPFAAPVETVIGELRRYREAGANAVMFDFPPPYDRTTLEALAGPVRAALDEG